MISSILTFLQVQVAQSSSKGALWQEQKTEGKQEGSRPWAEAVAKRQAQWAKGNSQMASATAVGKQACYDSHATCSTCHFVARPQCNVRSRHYKR